MTIHELACVPPALSFVVIRLLPNMKNWVTSAKDRSGITSPEKTPVFSSWGDEQRDRRRLSRSVVAFISILCILALPIWPIHWFAGFAAVVNKLSTSHSQVRLPVAEPLMPAGLSGNGRTTDVLWDKYSLVVKGQRIFMQ